jgi:hypothetical protein
MPLRALPEERRGTAPVAPYLLKTWVAARDFGDAPVSSEIDDDAAWLASLADQTAASNMN